MLEYEYSPSNELIDHTKWALGAFYIFCILIVDIDSHETSMHMREVYVQ